ncbi:MAG: hypothetical protein WKF79_03335 [Nocardioides sp.]
MTDNIKHAEFCTPQPGQPGPRIESFRSERTNDTGHVIARPLVTRCVDCGEQTVTG